MKELPDYTVVTIALDPDGLFISTWTKIEGSWWDRNGRFYVNDTELWAAYPDAVIVATDCEPMDRQTFWVRRELGRL